MSNDLLKKLQKAAMDRAHQIRLERFKPPEEIEFSYVRAEELEDTRCPICWTGEALNNPLEANASGVMTTYRCNHCNFTITHQQG